jgi:hypothetical protein
MRKILIVILLLIASPSFAQIGSGISGVPSAPIMTPATIVSGVTIQEYGKGDQQQLYKVTVTYPGWVSSAASLTGDRTIATIPAKTKVIGFYADTTTKYVGGGTNAAAITCGISAGGTEILATHDVFTNPITRGLADADMGTALVRAAAIQGGYMPSWTAATPISCRMTHTDDLTQGSTTFYIVVERY